MMGTPVGRVRAVGIVEAVSFLLLLGVAMPLKYAAGLPAAVFVVGWMHGVLFVAYAAVTLWAWVGGNLSAKLVGLAAVASLVPLGPLLLDRRLRAWEERDKMATLHGDRS